MKKNPKKDSDSENKRKSPKKTSKVRKSTENENTIQEIPTNDDNLEDSDKDYPKTQISLSQACQDESREENESESLKKRTEQIGSTELNQNDVDECESVPVKSIFNVEEFTNDDEIYTLQCPQNFKIQDLCNENLEFMDSEASFIGKSEVFQVKLLNNSKKFITLAVPNNNSSLVKLPFSGHIVLHNALADPTIEPMEEDDSNRNLVLFPNDLKVRHPLLGIDWKTHIDQANAALKNLSCLRKKNKKFKKEKIDNSSFNERNELKRESSESEISSPKKKRKKYNL